MRKLMAVIICLLLSLGIAVGQTLSPQVREFVKVEPALLPNRIRR